MRTPSAVLVSTRGAIFLAPRRRRRRLSRRSASSSSITTSRPRPTGCLVERLVDLLVDQDPLGGEGRLHHQQRFARQLDAAQHMGDVLGGELADDAPAHHQPLPLLPIDPTQWWNDRGIESIRSPHQRPSVRPASQPSNQSAASAACSCTPRSSSRRRASRSSSSSAGSFVDAVRPSSRRTAARDQVARLGLGIDLEIDHRRPFEHLARLGIGLLQGGAQVAGRGRRWRGTRGGTTRRRTAIRPTTARSSSSPARAA